MISAIDEARTTNLSSAIRLHVLANLKGNAQGLTQIPEIVG
jgi:predicted DNA-binding ribbon-helix-helix protein